MTAMTERIRLLICEDSDDDAVLIATQLRRGGLRVDYERVCSACAVAEALRLRPPDIVISDYNMPGFGAEDALRLLHESGLDVPFILVSGRIGEESAVALMRTGANDFILKNQMARLVPAVRRELQQALARRERRVAQEALRRSEERFRLLAEGIPDALFRYRTEPCVEVEYFSGAAATILGVAPEELCGNPVTVLSLVWPQDRACLEASWRSPPAGPVVIRWRRPDGTDVWTEQRAAALRDGQGRTVAVEGILRDITDRVRADAQRERLEQQLRQVERLESLGRLAGGITHDFNNLLSVIVGHADLSLAELPADSRARENLEVLLKLAERGAAFTRQLLVFSRQEPLEPETLDVNEVVALAGQVLRSAVDVDVEFATRLAPDLWPVRIDRSELERLLLNLVSNARRAMPGGGTLTIRTCNVRLSDAGDAPASRMVRLCVADTGVGMTHDVAGHAFEPYFTTDEEAGTGLGLAAAYGVVTAAGGTISLTSEPGGGTTVWIDLPAVSDARAAPPDPESPPPRGQGQRILVVEDDEDVRTVVSLMLSRADYEVVAAASPKDALAVLDEPGVSIDMLLTDIVMPGTSGIVLAEEVRDRLPGLPVLLMSGYTSGALPGDPVLPDGVSLIRKPFTTASLLRAVEAAQGRV